MKHLKKYYQTAKDWVVEKYKGSAWDNFVLGSVIIITLTIFSIIIGYVKS